jgi:hypothetical protein
VSAQYGAGKKQIPIAFPRSAIPLLRCRRVIVQKRKKRTLSTFAFQQKSGSRGCHKGHYGQGDENGLYVFKTRPVSRLSALEHGKE